MVVETTEAEGAAGDSGRAAGAMVETEEAEEAEGRSHRWYEARE